MGVGNIEATPTFQDVYDVSTSSPQIVVSAANGPVVVQDAAISIGVIARWRDNTPNDILTIAPSDIDVGEAAVNGRLINYTDINSGVNRPSITVYPDTITYTVTPVPGVITVGGTLVNQQAAGIVSFGGVINALSVYTQRASGFAFNNGLIFNHATTYRNESGFAANFGSFFTLVDQPLIEADGSARTGVIHNSVRAQPRFSRINAGTLAWSTCTLYETAGTVTAGVTVTTWNNFRAGNRAVFGGTITTHRGLFIDVLSNGITNIGIDCNMVVGGANRFIRHSGTTISEFSGDLHVNNGISLVLGTAAGNRVEWLRPAAGVARMIGVGGVNNEGLDWDVDTPTANNIEVTSSTGSGLQLNLIEIAAGTSATGGTNNWQWLFGFGAKTISLGGDFARVLFSASASVTLTAAISNGFTYTINEPAIAIGGGGSIVTAGNVLVQTAPSVGTNRYGVLITSNPSGGGGENRALRVQNGSSLFNHLEEEGGRTVNVRRDVAGFTLTRGNGGDHVVFGDTDGGGFTVNLPAAPLDGDEFLLKNVGGSGNTLTVGRNGNTINGLAANATLADGVGARYIFETTEGWQSSWGA